MLGFYFLWVFSFLGHGLMNQKIETFKKDPENQINFQLSSCKTLPKCDGTKHCPTAQTVGASGVIGDGRRIALEILDGRVKKLYSHLHQWSDPAFVADLQRSYRELRIALYLSEADFYSHISNPALRINLANAINMQQSRKVDPSGRGGGSGLSYGEHILAKAKMREFSVQVGLDYLKESASARCFPNGVDTKFESPDGNKENFVLVPKFDGARELRYSCITNVNQRIATELPYLRRGLKVRASQLMSQYPYFISIMDSADLPGLQEKMKKQVLKDIDDLVAEMDKIDIQSEAHFQADYCSATAVWDRVALESVGKDKANMCHAYEMFQCEPSFWKYLSFDAGVFLVGCVAASSLSGGMAMIGCSVAGYGGLALGESLRYFDQEQRLAELSAHYRQGLLEQQDFERELAEIWGERNLSGILGAAALLLPPATSKIANLIRNARFFRDSRASRYFVEQSRKIRYTFWNRKISDIKIKSLIGRTSAHPNTNDVTLGFAKVSTELHNHSHLATEVYYIRKGLGQLHLGGKTIDIQPGKLIYIPKGVPHHTVVKPGDPPVEILYMFPEHQLSDVVYLQAGAAQVSDLAPVLGQVTRPQSGKWVKKLIDTREIGVSGIKMQQVYLSKGHTHSVKEAHSASAVFVDSGKGVVTISGRRHVVSEGDYLYLPRGVQADLFGEEGFNVLLYSANSMR